MPPAMTPEDDASCIVVSTDTGNREDENLLPSSSLSSVAEPDLLDTTTSIGIEREKDQEPQAPVELNNIETAPAAPSPARRKKRVVVKKTVRKSKWNAENILTDPKSPLATADLRSTLSNPLAWDILDEKDRAEILALFPDNQHVLGAGSEEARPDFVSLMNDDSFRYDCAAYTENIAQGRHDQEWLATAWAAHERRKAGDFDEYLDNKFKNDWDVELPPELETRRSTATGDSDSDIVMGDVASNRCKISMSQGSKSVGDEEGVIRSDITAVKDEQVDSLDPNKPTIVAMRARQGSADTESDVQKDNDDVA